MEQLKTAKMPRITSFTIEFIIMANSTMHNGFVYLEQYFQGTLMYRFMLQPLHLNTPKLKKCFTMVLQTNKKPTCQLLTMKQKLSSPIYKKMQL